MYRCVDCVNYHNNRHRQCIAYNNEVSSKDDATHCCEFVNVKDNNTAIDYIAEQSKEVRNDIHWR